MRPHGDLAGPSSPPRTAWRSRPKAPTTTGRAPHPEPPPEPADGLPHRLTAAEELTLARAAAAGDAPARAALIPADLGLVRVIARVYLGRGLELDDPVGEGCVGPGRAADGFDPPRGVRFGPDAGSCIRQAILLALAGSGAIRVPSHTSRLLARWRRAERAPEQGRGGPPAEGEVAETLGLSAARRGIAHRARPARRARRESDLAPAVGRPAHEAAGPERPPGRRRSGRRSGACWPGGSIGSTAGGGSSWACATAWTAGGRGRSRRSAGGRG